MIRRYLPALLLSTLLFSPSVQAQSTPSHFEANVFGAVEGRYTGRATHERTGVDDGYRLVVWLGGEKDEEPFRLVLVLPGEIEIGHQIVVGDYAEAQASGIRAREAYAAAHVLGAGNGEPLLSRVGYVQVTRLGAGGLSLRFDIETHPVDNPMPIRVRGYADSKPVR